MDEQEYAAFVQGRCKQASESVFRVVIDMDREATGRDLKEAFHCWFSQQPNSSSFQLAEGAPSMLRDGSPYALLSLESRIFKATKEVDVTVDLVPRVSLEGARQVSRLGAAEGLGANGSSPPLLPQPAQGTLPTTSTGVGATRTPENAPDQPAQKRRRLSGATGEQLASQLALVQGKKGQWVQLPAEHLKPGIAMGPAAQDASIPGIMEAAVRQTLEVQEQPASGPSADKGEDNIPVQDDVIHAEDLGTEAIREATDNEAGAVGTPHLAELIAKLTAGKKTLSQGLLAELGDASRAASRAVAGQNGFEVDPMSELPTEGDLVKKRGPRSADWKLVLGALDAAHSAQASARRCGPSPGDPHKLSAIVTFALHLADWLNADTLARKDATGSKRPPQVKPGTARKSQKICLEDRAAVISEASIALDQLPPGAETGRLLALQQKARACTQQAQQLAARAAELGVTQYSGSVTTASLSSNQAEEADGGKQQSPDAGQSQAQQPTRGQLPAQESRQEQQPAEGHLLEGRVCIDPCERAEAAEACRVVPQVDPAVQHERARQALAELASQSLSGLQGAGAAEQAAQSAPAQALCGMVTANAARDSLAGMQRQSGVQDTRGSEQPSTGTQEGSGFEVPPGSTQPQPDTQEGTGCGGGPTGSTLPQSGALSGSGPGQSPGSRQPQPGAEWGGDSTQPRVPGPHSPLPQQAVSDLNTSQGRQLLFVVPDSCDEAPAHPRGMGTSRTSLGDTGHSSLADGQARGDASGAAGHGQHQVLHAAEQRVVPTGEEDDAASVAAGMSRKTARRALDQLEYAVMKTRLSKVARSSYVRTGKWQMSAAGRLKMCPSAAFKQAVKKALC